MLDIFSMDIDVATTMKKYFRTIYRISEITTTTNLSYFNFRGERINKYVQNNLIKVSEDATKIDKKDPEDATKIDKKMIFIIIKVLN